MEALSRHARAAVLFVGLLSGFFLLMSYQANRAETISAVQGTIQMIVSPVHRSLSAVWLGISGVWRGYVGLIGATSEAAALRQRLALLGRENALLQEAGRENARLRQLLGLSARIELSGIAAETIGRDIAHGYEAIVVNRGSHDGVAVDAPVLAPNGGLVGRVVRVSAWTATVQLITDPRSAVGVKDARTEAVGVVHGMGGPVLEVAYVHSLEKVEIGDLVVTSGDDRVYPPGLQVGRVSKVTTGSPVPGLPRVPIKRDEGALFHDVALEPMVDVTRVDQVLILEPTQHGG